MGFAAKGGKWGARSSVEDVCHIVLFNAMMKEYSRKGIVLDMAGPPQMSIASFRSSCLNDDEGVGK